MKLKVWKIADVFIRVAFKECLPILTNVFFCKLTFRVNLFNDQSRPD